MKLITIPGFRVGTHIAKNGKKVTFNRSDIDRTISMYDPEKGHEAPLCIGHPKEDKPAYGWIKGLERVGDVLNYKVKPNNEDVSGWIKNKFYKKVSASFYGDGRIKHLGLLGAQPPAIKGLPAIHLSEDDNHIEVEFSEIETNKGEDMPENTELEELRKELKAEQKKNAEFSEAIEKEKAEKEKALSESERQAKEFAERQEKTEKEIAEMQSNLAKKEAQEFCEGLIKEGKLLPANRNSAIELLQAVKGSDYEFSEGNKPVIDVLKSFLSDLPKAIEFSEVATKGTAQRKELKSYDKAIQERMQEKGISYSRASREVLSENPEFAEQVEAEIRGEM